MRIRTALLIGSSLILVSGLLFFGSPPAHAKPPTEPETRIKVFVSILPQAYFLTRVGGDRVDVSVMVGPGHSPATYEPVPRQMAELSKAKLYFRIGVPFENVWIERVGKANPDMRVIDTRHGIDLLPMKVHPHRGHPGDRIHGEGLKDPHIWLSPRLVKVQVRSICDALISEDPAHALLYQDNTTAFHRDLDALDADIAQALKNLRTRKFMAFHPAWGYFAQDYRLEQVPIEMEGKEPTARALGHLIEQANEEKIRVIFVQEQFSRKSAEAVARAINGKVIQMDPLARDYLHNMRKIASSFAEVM